jgi:hypothetical protein
MRKRLRCADIWPIDPASATPPIGWDGWPDGKKFALVLTHDVDTAKGQERCRQLAHLELELGFRSSFNFVPRRYPVSAELRRWLVERGFEVGVHGLFHDGKYFASRETFRARAKEINKYLKEWGCAGFRCPSMLHDLKCFHDLDIEYDASTFDTDPFEPQPDGVGTIFPFYVHSGTTSGGYVELPYTLPQDFTLFALMGQRDINIWKGKLDWIVQHGGMALLNTHPDYTAFDKDRPTIEEYPVEFFREFLDYLRNVYADQYWQPLPREMAHYVAGKDREEQRGPDVALRRRLDG